MIAIVTDEFTILIIWKYGFKVCVILFGFYSTQFKVYIHLPCINTQRQTTSPFNITPDISSRNCQTTWLYQGSANNCKVYHNYNIIRLLQPSQAIHYSKQSGLAIVLDLNILVFSITSFDVISIIPLVRFSLLCAIYLYNLKGIRFYILFSWQALRLRDCHYHGWVYYINTTKIRFKGLCNIIWFLIILFGSLYTFTLY